MATQAENVSEEIQTEEVVQPPKEQEALSQPTQVTTQKTPEESSKEYNFKQLRDVNKQLEDRLRIYEEKETSSQEDDLGEEDLVEGKHLKKGLEKLEKLILQKELETVPDKLRDKFKDFDQVVTRENLEKLKETEPELYLTIKNGSDLSASGLFAKGVAAYKTLMSLESSTEQTKYMKQKDQVHENHKKPLPTQAVKGSGQNGTFLYSRT